MAVVSQQQQGQFLQADFFGHDGGLNLTDSPFATPDDQATGGYNYEYALTGGIRKRFGHTKLNSVADTALRSVGFAKHISIAGVRTAIRCADKKIQAFDPVAYTFTSMSEDTLAAGTDFLATSNTVGVVNAVFATATTAVTWLAGGGMTSIYGAYSGTKVTKNGATPPTGAITVAAGAGSSSLQTGTYRYAVALRKTSTQAISNVALEQSVAVTAGQNVTVTLSGLTGVDTTKYDKIYIYRSALGGAVGFTTGDLVTTVNTGTASYADTGTASASSVSVPRSSSTTLDNSELPSGTVKCMATWKRRLVAAIGNTLYFSDLNKSESWPTLNTITIPSAGDITGLAVISYSTVQTQDEILAVFKEGELWIVTGTALSDWALKFIDNTGCVAQPLIVAANGFLAWVDYRGIYLWDGSDKPIYASRMIEPLFGKGGDLDKSLLTLGWGAFFRKNNEIYWCLPHLVKGENKFMLKMDLRLSIPNVKEGLGGRVMDAVFIQDSLPFSLYSGGSYMPTGTFEEMFLSGDSSGFVYNLFDGFGDGSSGVDFSYETKYMDFGAKSTTKRFHKIIVWTEDSTDADLTLDFWTGYKSAEDEKTTQSQPASHQVTEALWDLAYWDSAYWEQTLRAFNPIVFNLSSTQFGTEGDCLKLRFRQSDANAPITIAGFTVVYTLAGMRK